MRPASIITLLTILSAATFAQSETPCVERNEAATKQAAAAAGHWAEALLSLDEDACTGVILTNVAHVLSVAGRLAEAEQLAERSIRIVEGIYPPDSWMLLRPLQVLAAVRLESGKTAKAREVIRRIQSIHIEHPEDRAVLRSTAGVLLQIEGRRSEAEAEYREAIRAWEEAGRGDSSDTAATLNCLATLYLEEQRLDEARRVLDRALAINEQAKDSMPVDRISLLHLRGVLHARLGEWLEAEQYLREALSQSDRQPQMNPALLRQLLGSYSYVLRRNHRAREARSIEARRAALPASGTMAGVVDVTDLLVQKEGAKKRSMRRSE